VYITCFCANIHKKSHTVVLTFDTVKSNYDTIFFSTGASVITPQPILSFRLSADKKETVAPKKNVETKKKGETIERKKTNKNSIQIEMH